MLLRFGDDILIILQTGKKKIPSPVVGRQLGDNLKTRSAKNFSRDENILMNYE